MTMPRYALALAGLLHLAANADATGRRVDVRPEQRAMAALATQLHFFARHPEAITVANVEQAFPGRYDTGTCGSATYCTYENTTPDSVTKLSSFNVLRQPRPGIAGGGLHLALSRSIYCLRREELDRIFGEMGRKPRVPPPPDFFGGPFVESETFHYRSFNTERTSVSITVFTSDDCVSDIDLRADPIPPNATVTPID